MCVRLRYEDAGQAQTLASAGFLRFLSLPLPSPRDSHCAMPFLSSLLVTVIIPENAS